MKRFVSMDPLGYVDSMNMYESFGCDPVNNVDPMGLTKMFNDMVAGLDSRIQSDIKIYQDKVQSDPSFKVVGGPEAFAGYREKIRFVRQFLADYWEKYNFILQSRMGYTEEQYYQETMAHINDYQQFKLLDDKVELEITRYIQNVVLPKMLSEYTYFAQIKREQSGKVATTKYEKPVILTPNGPTISIPNNNTLLGFKVGAIIKNKGYIVPGGGKLEATNYSLGQFDTRNPQIANTKRYKSFQEDFGVLGSIANPRIQLFHMGQQISLQNERKTNDDGYEIWVYEMTESIGARSGYNSEFQWKTGVFWDINVLKKGAGNVNFRYYDENITEWIDLNIMNYDIK